MPLVLHKVLSDGSISHEDFTKASWEASLKNKGVVRRWGHSPGDCHDPVVRLFEREFTPVKTLEVLLPPEPVLDHISWPPDLPMSPYFFSGMCGLCVDDCKDILTPLPKDPPMEGVVPMDGEGQFRLF